MNCELMCAVFLFHCEILIYEVAYIAVKYGINIAGFMACSVLFYELVGLKGV